METQSLINYAVMAAFGIAGWLGRTLWDAVEKLKEDVHQIEVDLPKSYVPKEDWSESLKKIESMLEKIFDKLDQKADK